MAKAHHETKIILTRLRKRTEFLRVQRAGVRHLSADFILQAVQQAQSGKPIRIGYTASKKIGNAVQRNRAKRRMRALMHMVLSNPLLAGQNRSLDYVMIARQTLLQRDFSVLLAELHKAVQTIHQKLASQSAASKAVNRPQKKQNKNKPSLRTGQGS